MIYLFEVEDTYYYSSKTRNSRPEMFCKKGVLKNFAKFCFGISLEINVFTFPFFRKLANIHTFYITNAFFNSASVLFNFFMN